MREATKRTLKRLRPSPPIIVAVIALSVAIGGTAVAGFKIGTKQIKNNAVTTKKLKNGAVTVNKLKNSAVTARKLKNGSVTQPKIAMNAVDDSRTADYKMLGNELVRVQASDGVDEAAARDAAPAVVLLEKGPFTFYAKCFRNTTTDELIGEMYVSTSEQFSLMEGYDDFAGGVAAADYLNPDTPEAERRLDRASVTGPGTEYDESEGTLAGPGGIGLQVLTTVGTKNGAVFANGPYGPGNACVFRGVAMG